MEDLYKAIVANGLQDLFLQDKNKEIAYAWFLSDEDSGEDHISFIDACDLADYDHEQWRKVAELIYSGKLTKKQYLIYISESYQVERKQSESAISLLEQLPMTTYLYTERDAQDYIAQASLS